MDTVVQLFNDDPKKNSHTLWAAAMQNMAIRAEPSDRLSAIDKLAVQRAVPFINAFIASTTISPTLKSWPIELIITKGDEGEIYFIVEMVPKLGKKEGEIPPSFIVMHHPVVMPEVTSTFCHSALEATLSDSKTATSFWGLRYKGKVGHPRFSTISRVMETFQLMADVYSNGYLTKEETGKVTYTFFSAMENHSLSVNLVLPTE
jgi:hypothetical protein